MEITFAEIVIVVLAVAGLYALLRPLQARIEAGLRRFFDPPGRNVIDAEIVHEPPRKRKKDPKEP